MSTTPASNPYTLAAWLIDADARVLRIHRGADAWLSGGGELRLECGRLTFRIADHQTRFLAALRDLVARLGADTLGLTIARDARLPLTVLMARASVPGVSSAVWVALRDPESTVIDVGLLQALFGLTRAEAVVIAEIAQGRTPAAIAQSLGVQANTVAAHIKKVQAKTGMRRQVELVSMVLRSVAACPANQGHDLAVSGNDIVLQPRKNPIVGWLDAQHQPA